MVKKKGTAIHWFRRDLRLSDNPAFKKACEYEKVIPLFIWDDSKIWGQKLGAASKWWLHHSLLSLDSQLKKKGSNLIIRQGDPLSVLLEIVASTKAQGLFWNELYEPQVMKYDKKIFDKFSTQIQVESYNSYLLHHPQSVLKKDGSPYVVFTAFFNAATAFYELRSLEKDPIIPELPEGNLKSLPIEKIELEPKINWTDGLAQTWIPGEVGAKKLLKRFDFAKAQAYTEDRNIPSIKGTSSLSPHLHFGEISPSMIMQHLSSVGVKIWEQKFAQFAKELFWREFSHYLLFHFPKLTKDPLRLQFLKFPWRKDERRLKLWQKGQTGYPIVDAGMRELWHTGWMHNRVRMIVASFLLKDLMISWKKGAEWFWDTLVDANLANNIQGWQWTAGCGADAAPYFRIFNPVLQSRKFDPKGEYIKKWCPELKGLSDKYIHEPWGVDPSVLKKAGVELGGNYPFPIIEHSAARIEALAAYDSIKFSNFTNEL